MQHYITHMGNALTYENMPKYKFKLPQGANTDTIKTNGAKPNQDFEKKFPKINKPPQPFFENPQLKTNLEIFLHNLRKECKDC